MLDLEYLAGLVEKHREWLQADVHPVYIWGTPVPETPSLMGVVNLSADSWYRESVCLTPEQAVNRAHRLHLEGASLIDLGAESTLPAAERVDGGSQRFRLDPVLEQLTVRGIPTSIETYLPEVAAACLEKGAAVLNLTGPENNQEMFQLAAKYKAGVIICYVQAANVREAGNIDLVDDHISQMMDFFSDQIESARSKGVSSIWIDPGMGFYYKNLTDGTERVRYQLRTFFETFRLRSLGWPVCHALPHAFEQFGEEVRCAEPFFAVAAVLGKTGLLRTHEVAKVKAVVATMQLMNSTSRNP